MRKLLFSLLAVMMASTLGYLTYAINEGDDLMKEGAAGCYKMVDASRLEGCLYSTAVYMREDSMCPSFTDAKRVDYCYWNIAYYSHDDTLCGMIKNTSRRLSCYRAIAQAAGA